MLILDLLGTFFFAVSGSLLAARKHFDIVGSLLLASLAGLGGGVVRDLVLHEGVPNAFDQPVYLVPVAVAALLVLTGLIHETRFRRTLLLFDAAGLALFCIGGTVTAHAAGINAVSAALLGLTSAVGGGVLRDVVANEVPQLFNPRGVYAIPAMLGAALTGLLLELGWFSVYAGGTIAVLVFGLRVLSLRLGWHVPLANGRRPVQ
ncbi:TRIC cation channel family protein [Zhihengliuella sp.]|uniref:trimeric intracellular cation channel family protein n=1 Tax=Zhihengliuella sp. TaxID=1954483 RepID=UPI0028126655|nr:TRIC cation channel family protein [Zhihengliuella sp.]